LLNVAFVAFRILCIPIASMGDLAARLRSKGLDLPWDASAPSLHGSANAGSLFGTSSSLFAPSKPSSDGPLGASSSHAKAKRTAASAGAVKGSSAAAPAPLSAPAPAPLGLSQAEKRSLFTPLAEQGQSAIKQEQQRQLQSQGDLLKGVEATLVRWVQECLARDEKRDKLVEKGMLKCRVQAKWSDGLDESLKQLARGYGAKLAVDGGKENAEKHPEWLRLARNEKWLIGFDAAAFETFLAAHPETLDAPCPQLRVLAEGHAESVAKSPQVLSDALFARFGPLRHATMERARKFALMTKRGAKRKGGPGGRPEEEQWKARIEWPEDVAWAAATLAPMGLRPTGEPLVRVPASAALPILEGLGILASMPDLVRLLRDHGLGKVVSGYRHHPKPEVAKVAKDLVSSWRAAFKEK